METLYGLVVKSPEDMASQSTVEGRTANRKALRRVLSSLDKKALYDALRESLKDVQ